MLQVRRVAAFEDNYIWLPGHPGNPGVAVVDPGEPGPVIARIDRESLEPDAILITHHHGDHTGGIDALVARYGLPVYGPANEPIPHLTHPLREGDEVMFELSGVRLRVVDTPGHTRGHICYIGNDCLFCGDTLFTAGSGRIFEGTAEQMFASLEKLRVLPDSTLMYCAHEYTLANLRFARLVEPGNEALRRREADTRRLRERGQATVPNTLGIEKQTNPFLRCHVPDVIEAAQRFAGRKLMSPAEVFSVVRSWKDSLD